MHEENASDEADALAVAHFLVQQTVGFQQVEQLQLSRSQRLGKVRMARESTTCKQLHSRRSVSWKAQAVLEKYGWPGKVQPANSNIA